MNTIHETMADYNEVVRSRVEVATFGHLAAKKDKTYSIHILFSVSSFNSQGVSLINTKYGKNLNDSPWLYDAMLDRIGKSWKRKPGVYMIEGIIKNYRIIGKVQKVRIPN